MKIEQIRVLKMIQSFLIICLSKFNWVRTVYHLSIYTAQCVYTHSHAYMTKIPMTYHEAPTTNFRLFWDADSWNFSNIKTINAFRTLWLLPVLAPFFKVSIVKNQRFHSVANSQLVPNDFQLLKALSHLGLMWK